jgi:hypothetical protein
MYVAEIDVAQELLPLYDNGNHEAQAAAQAELAGRGIALAESNFDQFKGRLDASNDSSRREEEARARDLEQAVRNSELLASFRLLLPSPVGGALHASSDNQLEEISRNVIWDREAPAYLVGRLTKERGRRYGRALIDYTINHPTGSEGLTVVKLNNVDVDKFVEDRIFNTEIDKRIASKLFNPTTGDYAIDSRSKRSIVFEETNGSGASWRRRLIRTSSLIKFDEMHQFTSYSGPDAIPDSAMRDYEVLHHISMLASRFGVIDDLHQLLESRKTQALEV